jgi:hypothetical protein
MITAQELLRKGGDWLGAARSWMQCKKLNGSRVTWGSQEELSPQMTVRDVEEVAAAAAAAQLNRIENIIQKRVLDLAIKEKLLTWIRE